MASASSHSAPGQSCAVKTLNQTIAEAYSKQDSSRCKHDDRAAGEFEVTRALHPKLLSSPAIEQHSHRLHAKRPEHSHKRTPLLSTHPR